MPTHQITPVDLDRQLSPWTEVVGHLTELSRTRTGVRCTIETKVQLELTQVDETELEEYLGRNVAILNAVVEYRLRTEGGDVQIISKELGKE